MITALVETLVLVKSTTSKTLLFCRLQLAKFVISKEKWGGGWLLRRVFRSSITIATIVMAIYAWQSYQVQERLAAIEELSVSMSTEPVLSGAVFRNEVREKIEEPSYYYRMTNIGGDTAWSIFVDLRVAIVTDSHLIYGWGYYIGHDVIRFGVFPGGYKKNCSLSPGVDTLMGFNFSAQRYVKLAQLMGGTLLFEVHRFYWGAAPVVRKEEVEYFNVIETDDYKIGSLRKLDNQEELINNTLRGHKAKRAIGEIRFADRISGPSFYSEVFPPNTLLLLLNRVPDTLPFYYPQITYKDTLIFINDSIHDFRVYRKRFPEWQPWQRYLDSLDQKKQKGK